MFITCTVLIKGARKVCGHGRVIARRPRPFARGLMVIKIKILASAADDSTTRSTGSRGFLQRRRAAGTARRLQRPTRSGVEVEFAVARRHAAAGPSEGGKSTHAVEGGT